VDGQWVEIEFDCLPLRSVGRLDVPLDASPKFAQFVVRVKEAIAKHGSMNAYYLHRSSCTFHVTNDAKLGAIRFEFEGTILTDRDDRVVRGTDLMVRLASETCDWLSEPIVRWLSDTVSRAVSVEFQRYIEAGDLSKTEERLRKIQAEAEASGGYVGMYL
jgi:hypothetical protein